MSAQLDECSIEELSVHKNTGKVSHNGACSLELEYIVKFKELYPDISVAQFKDIYEEDRVYNRLYKNDVEKDKQGLKRCFFLKLSISFVLKGFISIKLCTIYTRTIPCSNILYCSLRKSHDSFDNSISNFIESKEK